MRSAFAFLDRNECNLKPSTRIHWRASLVPAAAVIPAPVAYAKVVAVEKLVVELLAGAAGPLHELALIACVALAFFPLSFGGGRLL